MSIIQDIIDYIFEKLKELLSVRNKRKNLLETKIMYIVKADNPDVGFSLSFTATDSEGNIVPDANLSVSVDSDNSDAVSITPDGTGRAGTVTFGNPGLANVNVTVEDTSGNLIGSFGAQFTVTVGDPAAISGGTLVFGGLTEIPPVPVTP